MRAPRVPKDEKQRLKELYLYEILDTLPERDFDQITELASKILNMPTALISLVDQDRQWFKAKCNLHADETSREVSFCGHVVVSKELLIVHDALLDDRFFDNPLVTGYPHIRFYLGVPLTTPSQQVIGTLCVLDSEPREVSTSQIEQLEILAKFVINQLELRRKNLELNRQRAELKTIFEHIQAGVVVCGGEGEVSDYNQRAEEIIGVQMGESLRKHLLNLQLLNRQGAKVEESSLPCEKSRLYGTATSRELFKCSNQDQWLMISSSPIKSHHDDSNSGFWPTLTHITDVSELMISQRETQTFKRKLAEQDRLATVGTLAAGVGHEINNPLSYIYANIDYVTDIMSQRCEEVEDQDTKDCYEELCDVLSEVREGAERIGGIVAGLNSFARTSDVIIPVNLNELIQLSVQMTRSASRSIAQVSVQAEDKFWVLGEKSRISQTLVNLILNALQSFKEPNITQNKVLISCELSIDQRHVIISIRDNGSGIDEIHRDRVFDPFFTTKLIGEGTGLGLSISQQHLNSLGGAIWFDSFTQGERTPAQSAQTLKMIPELMRDRLSGTDFYVSLPIPPVRQDMGDDALHPLLTPIEELEHKPQVLLIDDEVSLLKAFERLFQTHLELTTYSDPRKALQRCLEEDTHYDVILCDVMMPHLNGIEFYHQLLSSRADLAQRFAFVTGGVTQDLLLEAIQNSGRPMLCKPIKVDEVLRIVSQLIEPI